MSASSIPKTPGYSRQAPAKIEADKRFLNRQPCSTCGAQELPVPIRQQGCANRPDQARFCLVQDL